MGCRPFNFSKECTTCDVCGGRLVIPPGVVYRGEKMHKHEASRRRREDRDTEVKAPYLNSIKDEIEDLLDVEDPDA